MKIFHTKSPNKSHQEFIAREQLFDTCQTNTQSEMGNKKGRLHREQSTEKTYK